MRAARERNADGPGHEPGRMRIEGWRPGPGPGLHPRLIPAVLGAVNPLAPQLRVRQHLDIDPANH